MSRSLRPLLAVLIGLAFLAGACRGGASNGGDGVTWAVVAHETTQDVRVFAPGGEGSWPVVFALHGIDGSADQMAELGRRVAREGVVVFAPNYRTDLTTQEGQVELARDVECAYRFARSIAAEYGGDLDKPVTFVGWSLGASLAIQGGLDEEIDPSERYISCLSEVPRADVIVAVSGCHNDMPHSLFDPAEWTNALAEIVLVAGGDDTSCPASQSRDAATALRSAGYDVELVTLEGADHFAPVFHEFVDGEMVLAPDDPAGDEAVDVILNAITAAKASR